ncbi:hypothetical protein ACFL2H_00605 [Planctomycetota bacterium]
MKKLFLLLGLSCALFIGCQKAEEPAAEPAADPAGTEEVETTEGGEAEAAEGEEAATTEEE